MAPFHGLQRQVLGWPMRSLLELMKLNASHRSSIKQGRSLSQDAHRTIVLSFSTSASFQAISGSVLLSATFFSLIFPMAMNPFAIWNTAANCMADDGSGTGGQGWYPAQSAHGVLPMASTPGSLPPSLIGKPTLTFRFMARGRQSNMSVVGPNFRPCFRVLTNSTATYVHAPSGPIAVVHWQGPTWNSADPVVERNGQQMRASAYLPEAVDANGRRYDHRLGSSSIVAGLTGRHRVRRMMIGTHHYMWTFDNKGFYVGIFK